MIHMLDREDRALRRRALAKLASWINDYKKTAPAPHPFTIVGVGKSTRSFDDRSPRKN
jgi:hypothetical protein